jgi:hypothetical protein
MTIAVREELWVNISVSIENKQKIFTILHFQRLPFYLRKTKFIQKIKN